MAHHSCDMPTERFHSFKGNVVLCGLRNGSIIPVDVRQNHHHHPTGLPSSSTAPSTARRTVPMLPPRNNGRRRNQTAMDKCSRVIYMSSAVCSLVALSSDENYFLGSSMDGSHKLVIHVAFFMPGGEDCTVRIWSIKTGELIFAQRVADTLFTALSWPESSLEMCGSLLFDVNHSWGAWLGSRDGLFYMHGT
ncbi:hypothetical protein PR202_ga28650 [Eleusine coracana subsp. coracana]|uniref:Uncharacterized protein n=1 Tax=Eleusine coracana subsp. coracana TaxID=191504 RepID=A0AAV5DJQ2_ELECO|nr:hypothetical protein PR202_ga28650 [Eleusine coracana subsp. coracana]